MIDDGGLFVRPPFSFVRCCVAVWLIGLGLMVLALVSGGAIQRVVYGVGPLIVGGVIVVRESRRGLVRCGALLLAAVAADSVLYHLLRGEPDQGLFVTWDEANGVFSWGSASVQLPAGFGYEQERGIDTLIGRLTSTDGGIVILHDIGELAGEHRGTGGVESLRGGVRVRIGIGGVAFPDSGCAVFVLEADSANGRAVIESLARSFKPASANWLRPLLPELLRSDCRSRIRIPFE